MVNYKIKLKKIGCCDWEFATLKAKNVDHLFLLVEDFLRKNCMYSEWVFLGKDEEL